MTDSDEYIEDVETDKVMRQLTKPLFPTRKRDASRNDASPTMWAVTVNIQPTKRMNKKFWKLYTPAQQVAQLTRIEEAFRRQTPSCELVEIHFETCPILQNMHFHALYKMPEMFKAELESYYMRICDGSDENTKEKWRYLDISPVKNLPDWINYIRKDQASK